MDIVEELKSKLSIDTVIETEGYHLEGTGRYRRDSQHNSLVVDLRTQAYHWNSSDEHGDIFTWVMKRKNADFKGAVEILCRMAGLPDPDWGHQDMKTRMMTRARQDAFTVAARVFHKWLMKDAEALAYARGRGWTDETILQARLGYTGQFGYIGELTAEMTNELSYEGVQLDSPAAIAVTGRRGDGVLEWGERHGVTLREKWVQRGQIPGLIGQDMLVYPHLQYGQVTYFSGRGVHEKRHYNIPDALAGSRQPYFNTEWSPEAFECVIVEGQACAVTLAQWGIPAVALAGTSINDDLIRKLSKNKALYLAMDSDKAGETSARKNLAKINDPLIRIVSWGDELSREGDRDANDWLKSLAAADVDQESQKDRVRNKLATAETWVEMVCVQAGQMTGAHGEEAIRTAMELVARMDDVVIAQYRTTLSKALNMGVRDFQNILKSVRQTAEQRDLKTLVEGETLGGIINGWLIEYLYDPEHDQARLAYRNPDGEIGERPFVDIDGVRYYPSEPNAFVRQEVVLFPSKLGPVKSTRELVAIIEAYIRSVYLWPDAVWPKLVAYYVLLTWIYDAFNALPYLRAMGEAGSGKSEMMRRVGHVCYRMMTASGANTASTFFRATEMYRGTVFIDEADLHDGGDMANDIVKFLNLGAMKGNPISRTVESKDRNGDRIFIVQPFNTYCPKLIAMRKEFKDDAVATRSLTMKLIPREPIELKEAGVKLTMNSEMRTYAREIRNMCLRWRLTNWEPEIEIDEDDIDLEISSRLNQVTTSLLRLAKGDDALKTEIRNLLRAYNQDIILGRSMTVYAKVVEAMWKIWLYEDLQKDHTQVDQDGRRYTHPGDVAKIANELIDRENALDEDDEEGQSAHRKKRLTSPGVGRYMKNDLGLIPGGRKNTGIAYYFDENEIRLQGLAKRYGVNVDLIKETIEKVKTTAEKQDRIPF